MSNKVEEKKMSPAAQRALLPTLRFPEFLGAGAWKTETLGSVATISTEKVGDQTCIPMSITSGVGLVSQQDKFGRIIAGSSYKNYLQLKQNDFAYNKSATKEYPEGYLALYSGEALAAVPNSIFTCFRIKGNSPVPQYLNYLFLCNLHGKWLRKFIQVGARAHGSLSINDNDLMALPLPLPEGSSSLAEQQKISDCLASIDELLAFEVKKLAALKARKKGLMQQLFPAGGETLPKLRFPEFWDAGEWVARPIGEMGLTIGGLSGKSGDDFGTGQPFVTYKQVFDCACIDFTKCGRVKITANERQNTLQRGDVLFTTSSETPDEVGYASVLLDAPPEQLYLNSFCFALRPHSLRTLMPEFSRYLFHSPIYRRLVTVLAQGSTRFNISKGAFLKLSLPIPKDEREQQKIAGFLFSIDELITTQTQKLATLKIHKKGLMQQLFPALDEVQG